MLSRQPRHFADFRRFSPMPAAAAAMTPRFSPTPPRHAATLR